MERSKKKKQRCKSSDARKRGSGEKVPYQLSVIIRIRGSENPAVLLPPVIRKGNAVRGPAGSGSQLATRVHRRELLSSRLGKMSMIERDTTPDFFSAEVDQKSVSMGIIGRVGEACQAYSHVGIIPRLEST